MTRLIGRRIGVHGKRHLVAPFARSLFGPNLNGLEFGGAPFPGTFGTDYTEPTADEATYFAGKGLKYCRLPFKWERLQPVLGGALDATNLGYITDFLTKAAAAGMTVFPCMFSTNSSYFAPGSMTEQKIGRAGGPTAAQVADFYTRFATAMQPYKSAITGSKAFDPASSGPNLTFSNANLTVTKNTSGGNTVAKTLDAPVDGNYYFEFTVTAEGDLNFGVANHSQPLTDWLGSANKGGIAWSGDGTVFCNDTVLGTIAGYATGAQGAIAVNLPSRLFWGKIGAGLWNNSGAANPSTGAGGLSFAAADAGPWAIAVKVNGVGDAATINPGTAFAQSVPSGFSAWPAPTRPASFGGYNLINEPNREVPSEYLTSAQAMINAIRTVDTTSPIITDGGAGPWTANNTDLWQLTDPNDNLWLSAHIYFDADFSGRYVSAYPDAGAYPDIGVDRIKLFTNWAAGHDIKKLWLGEMGWPGADAGWQDVANRALAYCNSINLAACIWAAGPWWIFTAYPLSIEPTGSSGAWVDKPQMALITANNKAF